MPGSIERTVEKYCNKFKKNNYDGAHRVIRVYTTQIRARGRVQGHWDYARRKIDRVHDRCDPFTFIILSSSTSLRKYTTRVFVCGTRRKNIITMWSDNAICQIRRCWHSNTGHVSYPIHVFFILVKFASKSSLQVFTAQ